MSRRSISPRTWYQTLGDWLLGNSQKTRGFEEGSPESADVEFLETRMVLTSVSGAGAEHLAPDTSSSTTTNPDGSTSTTSTTTTTNADGSITTTTTTTVTHSDGSTSTTSSQSTSAPTTSNASVDTDEAMGSAVQSDGKIVIVGFAQATASDATDANNIDFAVTRLNVDGSIDTTFGTNGKKTISFDLGGNGNNQDVATCVQIQADGKIVIGGYTHRGDGGNHDFAVARLNVDGSLDNSFSGDGKATVAFDVGGTGDDRATSMVIQPDGKIILAGYAQTSGVGTNFFAVTRLNTDGSLDQSFTGDGRKYIWFGNGDDRAAGVALQPDGGIVVVGYATTSGSGYDVAMARIKSNGRLDTSFSADGKKTIGFNLGGSNADMASSVAVQTDGAIVVGATIQNKNGDNDFGIIRVKASGSQDKSFGADGRKVISYNLGGNDDDQLTAVGLQADGKIVVGGITQISLTGDYDFAVARLNIDGSTDTSFSSDGKKTIPINLGSSDNDIANSLSIQSNGKIIMAGSAMKSNPNNTDFAVIRLDDDGSLDNSFGTSGVKTVPFDLT